MSQGVYIPPREVCIKVCFYISACNSEIEIAASLNLNVDTKVSTLIAKVVLRPKGHLFNTSLSVSVWHLGS